MNRKLTTAVLATLAIATLSGCGSSTDTKTTAPASSAAPATSSHPPAGGAVDGQAVATKVVAAISARKTAHVTMGFEGKPAGGGDVELTNPIRVAMKLSVEGESLEFVQLGKIFYLKGIPGTPKPWVKFDPRGTDSFSKAMSSVGDLSQTSDPRPWLAIIEGLTGKDLGTEHVGGLSTRQYAFKIPLSTFAKINSPESQKELQGMTKAPIAVEYSVDNDNLLRKLTTGIFAGGRTVSVEMIYSDWGKEVSIVAPPAAQVGPPPAM